MMEYKVCFHMSYTPPWAREQNRKKYDGKMHYCGHTLEEAIEKVRPFVARFTVYGRGTCTSLTILRGRRKGENIKWNVYHAEGEQKTKWEEALTTEQREMNQRPVNLPPFGAP